MNLGPYAGFIWAAWGLAALIIGGLIAWLIHDGRRQNAVLGELEARGIKRRSDT